MRSEARALVVLTAWTTIGAAAAAGQSSFALAFPTGPLFSGVTFGIVGPAYGPGSVFLGASFGHGYPAYSFGAHDGYGIYSSRAYGSDRCWDYAYGYDEGCIVTGSYDPWYSSYSWSYRRWSIFRPAPSRFAYVGDPFWEPWGPYWAYDPWGSYWNGYWNGYVSGSYLGRWSRGGTAYAYTPRHVRNVYVAPFRHADGTRYKESPGRVASGRTAQPRGTPVPTAPSRAQIAEAANSRPNGVSSVNRRAPAVGRSPSAGRPASGAAASSEPVERARGRSGAPAPDALRTPTVGRRPVAVESTTRGSPATRPGSVLRRSPPADRDPTQGSRAPAARTREAPATSSAQERPAARGAAPRASTSPDRGRATLTRRPASTRSGPSAARAPEATRATPRSRPATESAPRPAPTRARPAPAPRGAAPSPSTRPSRQAAPSRSGVQARPSAPPRGDARPAPRSGPSGAAPAPSRPSGVSRAPARPSSSPSRPATPARRRPGGR